MKMKLIKDTPENRMHIKLLRGEDLVYTERTLWLSLNEYLLEQDERVALAKYKDYSLGTLVG